MTVVQDSANQTFFAGPVVRRVVQLGGYYGALCPTRTCAVINLTHEILRLGYLVLDNETDDQGMHHYYSELTTIDLIASWRTLLILETLPLVSAPVLSEAYFLGRSRIHDRRMAKRLIRQIGGIDRYRKIMMATPPGLDATLKLFKEFYIPFNPQPIINELILGRLARTPVIEALVLEPY